MKKRRAESGATETNDRNQCQVCRHVWSGPKAGIFAPCWSCLKAKGQDGQPFHVVWPGCRRCYLGLLRDLACQRCGVWVMPHGLIWHGQQLSAAEFDHYPAAWRLEFYAVHGAPDPQWLPMIRAHLRVRYSVDSVTRLDFVNVNRREMGLEPLLPPPEAEEAQRFTTPAEVIASIGRKL